MKTALVTGAAHRLGAELARFFAQDGHRVIIHANSSITEAAALVASLEASGHEAIAFAADLTDEASVAQFVDQVVAAAGVPDIIVNNASVFDYDAPGTVDLDRLRKSFEVHAFAPILIMEAAVRRRRLDQSLAIFNILDQKLLNLNPDYFSYTIGKAALHAATQLWQARDMPGVRVFGILPGLLFPSGGQTSERYGQDVKKSPLQKPVTARAIYDAIAFFIRNENIKGQDLAVDGGENLTGRKRDVAFE
jgi:NAD(P)-dependent dehydrogenase (short-subunit alcohol dehydrogenase family)